MQRLQMQRLLPKVATAEAPRFAKTRESIEEQINDLPEGRARSNCRCPRLIKRLATRSQVTLTLLEHFPKTLNRGFP
jgi:hypothetical protein